MFSTKQLSEDQIKSIKSWAKEGANLSEMQLRMKSDLDISITYMDTRFLILDLGITLEEEPREEPAPEIVEPAPVPTGSVTVTMDSIAVAGTLVSGKVIFSDGEKAIWALDQTGRPSLDPDTSGYQPTQEDILEFQKQLREHIEASGL